MRGSGERERGRERERETVYTEPPLIVIYFTSVNSILLSFPSLNFFTQGIIVYLKKILYKKDFPFFIQPII